MNIEPLGNRLLVKRINTQEQKTESGLIVPEKGMPPTFLNEVVAVAEVNNPKVNVGDTVITTQFIGDEVKVNQESLFILDFDDILAIVRE